MSDYRCWAAEAELFLKGTPSGLTRLSHLILTNKTESMIKAISSIESIEPVTPAARTNNRSAVEVLKQSPRGKKGLITRVRLFNFGTTDQPQVVNEFLETCRRRGITAEQGAYAPSSYTYAVECVSEEDVSDLAKTIGVRSVGPMPIITASRPMTLNPGALPSDLLDAGQVDGEYPSVVVVDSGVSTQVPALASWVIGRESSVPPGIVIRNTARSSRG